MQSPQKLHDKLSELTGPPGPDADPLELTLRTVLMAVAPQLQQTFGGVPAEHLDMMLEGVALYFLRLRSDGAALSNEFYGELNVIEPGANQLEAPEEPPAAEPDPPAQAAQAAQAPPWGGR